MRIAIGMLFAVTVAACGEAGSGPNRIVDECIDKLAGFESSTSNRRAEFLNLFDPSEATIEELGPWSDNGVARRHVRVSIPRIAPGYFEGRYTRRSIGDEAICYMFERHGVWNYSYI